MINSPGSSAATSRVSQSQPLQALNESSVDTKISPSEDTGKLNVAVPSPLVSLESPSNQNRDLQLNPAMVWQEKFVPELKFNSIVPAPEDLEFSYGESFINWNVAVNCLSQKNNADLETLQDPLRTIVLAACPGNQNHRDNLKRNLEELSKTRGNLDGVQIHCEQERAAASADVLEKFFADYKSDSLNKVTASEMILGDTARYKEIVNGKGVLFDAMVAEDNKEIVVRKKPIKELLTIAKDDNEIQNIIVARGLLRCAKEKAGRSAKAQSAINVLNELGNQFAKRLETLAKQNNIKVSEIGRTSVLIEHSLNVLETRFGATQLSFLKNEGLRDHSSEFKMKKSADKGGYNAANVLAASKRALESAKEGAGMTAKDYSDSMFSAISSDAELDYVIGQEESFRKLANSNDKGGCYFYMNPRDVYMFVPEAVRNDIAVADWDMLLKGESSSAAKAAS